MIKPVTVSIVSFNTPYPPDFGGSMDVFYRIKALSEAGVSIFLHCFTYRDFKPRKELEKYCEKVFYYPRRKEWLFHFSTLPYIVSTRTSNDLAGNLKSTGAPVLFEGLHTCGILGHPDLKGIGKIVRMHNIEHRYYRGLSLASANPFRKLYYSLESHKLKLFEKIVEKADCIAAISPSEQQYFENQYKKTVLVPAFHPYQSVTSEKGKGTFFLYHGNLSVEENRMAAEFLCTEVFNGLDIPLVIAGKLPPGKKFTPGKKIRNIQLRINPDEKEMQELIREAQGCILPTFQDTGLKLKLLGSLFAGRFCIVNEKMVAGTGLQKACLVADRPSDLKILIKKTQDLYFTEGDIINREKLLLPSFSNKENGRILKNIIEKLQT